MFYRIALVGVFGAGADGFQDVSLTVCQAERCGAVAHGTNEVAHSELALEESWVDRRGAAGPVGDVQVGTARVVEDGENGFDSGAQVVDRG